MGFSEYERECFRQTCREYSEIESSIKHFIPDDLLMFLKQENHLKRTKDYCIFQRKPKINMAESIIATYLLDPETTIHERLWKFAEFLSPPVIKYVKY